ncbi:hypothetical protein JOC75_000556 [Metabacillus crassostreae]|uniref:hypothetical protein n=1 Tax=Metabacillus crassostreae TaxID=929098 RepID=UPI00195E52FB|nr:hypothetical protein [Metabacillus crassostreae]MBM7602586.1 hypothetical protein [Metabacillus crassostreae]
MFKNLNYVSFFLCFLLFSSAVLPNAASAATEANSDETEIKIGFGEEFTSDEVLYKEELPAELQELEDEIGDYLEEFEYTEEDYENMSIAEIDQVYNEIFNSQEFLDLEKNYEKEFAQYEVELNQGKIQPFIAPILVPIAAAAARVALQTIVKQGTKIASKYLKNKLKSVGKNYTLVWNAKNSKDKITSLLKIQHKRTKQIVFRIDNGTIPLKPGSSDWYWHYHIGDTPTKMKHHYSLRSLVPSKHKPGPGTTLY